jgi:hypothetical protein
MELFWHETPDWLTNMWCPDYHTTTKLLHVRLTLILQAKSGPHIISVIAFAIALYSTSAVDLENISCFLALQEIRFVARNIAKPLVDLLSSKQPAQSASQNPLTSIDDDLPM